MHKDRSVSTGASSLNGHDSSYIMSAKTAVLKVRTLGCKSTNMQLKDFHNPGGQQYNSSLLVWRQHDMPLQAVTCHFFVEAFIISQVISHCTCSMYHVLTYSRMSCSSVLHVTHLLILVPQNAYTKHLWHLRALSPSPGIQSLYTGKQMSLTATLCTAHCRNTN